MSQMSPPPPTSKKPWLAALLSLLMISLGHIYAGKAGKGFALLISIVVLIISIRFLAYTFSIYLILLVLAILFYLYAAIDAFLLVKKHPNGFKLLSWWDKWYIYLGILLLFLLGWNTFIQKRLIDAFTPINYAHIPTSAMSPNVQAGDKIAFYKTKQVQTNDVCTFYHPEYDNTLYIKRFVGLPGDSLEIKQAVVFANDQQIDDTTKLKYAYEINTSHGQPFNPHLLAPYPFVELFPVRDKRGTYLALLNEQQAAEIAEIKGIKSIHKKLANRERNASNQRLLTPPDSDWTGDYYGPIYIPQKGTSISITPTTLRLYASIIQGENQFCTLSDSTLFINEQLVTTYTFKDDYYFALGDNRHNSADSRYWGLVPARNVVGKALYTFWGKTMNRIGQEIE